MKVVQQLDKIVTGFWKESQVKWFGSYASQLYLPGSDIDIVVFYKNAGKNSLRKLAKVLVTQGFCDFASIKIISRARIPIIKLSEKRTQYKVDISINVENGVETVAVIDEMLIRQPVIKPLLFVLKHFLRIRGLNEVCSGLTGRWSVVVLAPTLYS